ncbi:hypothetical protein MF265_01600 [Serratia marcescens]|uniref:hypothetical protein n=1 Tax=Serratia marcescens TaxID=615 RepID=UPI001EF1311C|nr:hypothetical protein [Serratia marcescens]ULH11517.1 hypothetical protein MF265_01600 [Serratia marcescens]
MSDNTFNQSTSVEVINVAGQNIKLAYLENQGYWVAIKYAEDCEIFTGVTKDELMVNILNGLKCLN